MKSPAFSLYVRDLLCSKSFSKLHSKALAKGVAHASSYLYLLCNSWLENPRATLPDDDFDLAVAARIPTEQWESYKNDLMPLFQKDATGRWYNERLMIESEKQQNRSKAGSKGGSKKQANRVAALEDENEDENDTTYSSNSRVVLHWLNEKSGKHFRECESSLAPISARMKEPGVDLDGVKKMIERQCLRWLGTSQEEYLRPQTLFGKEKFDGYYAAKDLPVQTDSKKKNVAKHEEGF